MSQQTTHRHHAIDYVELTVTDLADAKRFYADAFGWQFTDYGTAYAGIQGSRPGSEVGGLRLDRRFHFTDPSGNELGVWAEA
ncbi:VOC family protein [Micromonospora sp. NPDC002389]|uniref:VOC family protein n=1 Tax=Micromonospora sp. NPDC002389 TaxID=3154272 RepID=UPI00332DC29E